MPSDKKPKRPQSKKQKKKSKPKPKKSASRIPGSKFTVAEREAMFVFWCSQDQNISRTAKKFGCVVNTVKKIRDKDAWVDLLPDVIDQVRKQSKAAAVRGISENLRSAQTILDHLTTKLEGQAESIGGEISDFVKLSKYIDEASGISTGGKDKEVIYVIEQILTASTSERNRIAGNFLADFGIVDAPTVERFAKMFPGKISTQN